VQRSFTGCACVIVCNLETLTMGGPRPNLGCNATEKERKKKNRVAKSCEMNFSSDI
jgi:hypothetical protein